MSTEALNQLPAAADLRRKDRHQVKTILRKIRKNLNAEAGH